MSYYNKKYFFTIDLSAPRFPRRVWRWRRVPRCLSWLCYAAAAPLWAFGLAVRLRVDTLWIGTEYRCSVFRLFEEPGGRWLFKIG